MERIDEGPQGQGVTLQQILDYMVENKAHAGSVFPLVINTNLQEMCIEIRIKSIKPRGIPTVNPGTLQ